MINIEVPKQIIKKFHRNSKIKIKFEIDIDPPENFYEDTKFLYQPIPFSVKTMSIEDLFAGKMHCVLFREWKERVKGRDWYDFVWFVARKTSLRLGHLESRSKKSGHIGKNAKLSEDSIKKLLIEKINKVDFDKAKSDISMFIKDPDSVKVWSKEFFLDVVSRLKIE
ncbi:MAG: nucleotidyl transferase AbiEii/AbiGii toxin family protein [Pseudomonadota bacterium]